MNHLDYSTTQGTKYHLIGGALFAFSVAIGAVVTGLFWALCMLIYQLYDSLPRQCQDWCHTKYDVLEIGFGGLVVGIVLQVVLIVAGVR